MGRIVRLDEGTVNRIAAGEVVERPAAVVKELVENSLDARASRIRVAYTGGGQERIEVEDDGEGMEPEDALLALERHATSKIARAEDLLHLRTLGFRGEALPSIAAVSRLTLTTRPADRDLGIRVRVEGGVVTATGTAGCAPGTAVTVEDLFYNTPARRKFLRTPAWEAAQIQDILSRLALSAPHVAFRVYSGRGLSLSTRGSGDVRVAFGEVYSAEVAEVLQEGVYAEEGVRVRALVAPADFARPTRQWQVMLVNRRVVQSLPLRYAAEEAFRGVLQQGRHPVYVLEVQVAEDRVDANVHPTKREVRFQDERRVQAAVYHAVRRALGGAAGPERGSPVLVPPGPREPVQVEWRAPAQVREEPPLPAPSAARGQPASELRRPAGLPPLRVLGQVGQLYLVCEGPEGLYLVDQHAAHERILYERLRRPSGSSPSQPLLVPWTLTVSGQEVEGLDAAMPLVRAAGFEAEAIGPTAVRVAAIPAHVPEGEARSLFLALVHEAAEPSWETAWERRLRRIWERMACRAAVKAGVGLTVAQMEQLLRELAQAEEPLSCPHGRPTLLVLSHAELERRFGRRG